MPCYPASFVPFSLVSVAAVVLERSFPQPPKDKREFFNAVAAVAILGLCGGLFPAGASRWICEQEVGCGSSLAQAVETVSLRTESREGTHFVDLTHVIGFLTVIAPQRLVTDHPASKEGVIQVSGALFPSVLHHTRLHFNRRAYPKLTTHIRLSHLTRHR